MTRSLRLFFGAFASALVAAGPGCAPAERVRPEAESRPLVQRDVPQILENMIGSETTLVGAEPVIVTGYGIVVGLNGTGSSEAPVNIRTWLEREMTLRGVGAESMGMGAVSPQRMLDDPNTAIVFVVATIAPGAPEGHRFDVQVEALPGSPTTSLEGGRLWTTDLRLGVFVPGGPEPRILARAGGPVFINPFRDPAKDPDDPIARTTGRILGGGVVTNPLELMLQLDNPSHTRSRAIAAAINTRYPQQAGDRGPTARGRSDESIALNVPERWRSRPEEFLNLIRYTLIDQSFPQERALRFVRAMRDEPYLASEISWAIQALGPGVTAQVREIYDLNEVIPRLAALRAGARLGDPLVTPHLKEIARTGPPRERLSAIELLADMPTDPQVNAALHELVNEQETAVRVAAYEALVKRRDPKLERRPVGNKFVLDIVPAKEPMIYVSQQSEPRIALFGTGAEIDRPALVFAWSDRLIVDSTNRTVRVMYRDHRSDEQSTAEVRHDLASFIQFLAQDPTPESPAPGLGLSYSETVGALYEVVERGRAAPVAFVAEQDRLQAELLATARTSLDGSRPELAGDLQSAPEERPETAGAPTPTAAAASAPGPTGEMSELSGPAPAAPAPTAGQPERRRSRYVVPIPPRDGASSGAARPPAGPQ